MKDVLETVRGWQEDGLRVATATLVRTFRSAPREAGAVMAVSEQGDVAGSVTGGCVEPALYEEAKAVLAGEPPRLVHYGISDDQAFEVGLPCGGEVDVFVDLADPAVLAPLAEAIGEEQPVALVVPVAGSSVGGARLVDETRADPPVRELLARGESGVVDLAGDEAFVSSFVPRARMYVFGYTSHAAAVAELGRFLGYRVTVCDARARFVTRERFPNVEELVTDWPDRFLAGAPVDERTAIVILSHDHRFDVPLVKRALATPAGYIGAMGSRKTTADRADRLRDEGVTDEELARVHAPIGLSIGSRSPEEVAVAVVAEIVSVMRLRPEPVEVPPARVAAE
ncbi:MAG TPA: XdhC/CoxI family protein [Gaiellaceae bacterium]